MSFPVLCRPPVNEVIWSKTAVAAFHAGLDRPGAARRAPASDGFEYRAQTIPPVRIQRLGVDLIPRHRRHIRCRREEFSQVFGCGIAGSVA